MDPDRELRGYGGVCRLFPLPNVVLFPHAVLPLHMFEPRYRKLTEDALAGDRLIAMAQIRPDADWNVEEDPAIEPCVCVGKIIEHRRLPDGRFNLLLAGLKRGWITRELPKTELYREAEVVLVDDLEPEGPCDHQRRELIELFRRLAEEQGALDPDMARLLDRDLPLGVLTDLLGHYLGLPTAVKLSFLSEPRVIERTRGLLAILRQILDTSRNMEADEAEGFPPPFSSN